MNNRSPLNNEHTKDKKKSLFERFFNFAGHTMKSKKKSSSSSNHKKRLKKSIDRSSTALLIKLENEGVETCTFCDYCNLEIVAKFTGQNIICHESCKDSNMETLKVFNRTIGSNSSTDSKKSISSEICEMKIDVVDRVHARLSSSVSDLRFDSFKFADDSTFNNSSISTFHFQPTSHISAVPTDVPLSSETDSYTFSTTDLSTIKQFGISIKKIEPLQATEYPATIKEVKRQIVMSPSNESFEQQQNSLPRDLTSLIDIFNDNDQGLFIETTNDEIMGKVRVFINLLRPIKMLLTARPPSIFDSFLASDKDKDTIQRAYYNKEAIFWLPRGTTKLLYININCQTSELIAMLLLKFNIQNNPKKFALYEHTILSPTEVEVRKFRPNQCPLKIMLHWCSTGKEDYQKNMKNKRFVLQENDPGSIEWDEFCIPELQSFLRILLQEEQEKKKQIIRQFNILRSEIERCTLKELSAKK